jgi:hypothetical protein
MTTIAKICHDSIFATYIAREKLIYENIYSKGTASEIERIIGTSSISGIAVPSGVQNGLSSAVRHGPHVPSSRCPKGDNPRKRVAQIGASCAARLLA